MRCGWKSNTRSNPPRPASDCRKEDERSDLDSPRAYQAVPPELSHCPIDTRQPERRRAGRLPSRTRPRLRRQQIPILRLNIPVAYSAIIEQLAFTTLAPYIEVSSSLKKISSAMRYPSFGIYSNQMFFNANEIFSMDDTERCASSFAPHNAAQNSSPRNATVRPISEIILGESYRYRLRWRRPTLFKWDNIKSTRT